MKREKLFAIIPLIAGMLFSTAIYAQSLEKCAEVVKITFDGVNAASADELKKHLSSDFSIAGQQGEIAIMVLDQLFQQLNEKVVSYKESATNKLNGGLELKYKVEYSKNGNKEATFLFDNSGKLKELTLFKMEVKTMSGDSQVVKPNSQTISIPFKMVGNLIGVQVKLNGEMRTFILDSGAPVVILNARYLEKRQEGQTLSTSRGVNGSITGMDITTVEELDFHGLKLSNEEVITLDLSHLEEELGAEIHGLIGFDMIKEHDILYDYAAQTITLIDPDHFETYRSANMADRKMDRVPLAWEGHIPVVKATIGGKTYSFGIDSGAELNLMDDDLWSSMKSHIHNTTTDTLVGADNHPMITNKADIMESSIGETKFTDSPTVFSDISHLNEGYKMEVDGLIGHPMLSKQLTLLSVKRSEMVVWE